MQKVPSAPRPSAAQIKLIDDLGGPTAVARLINERLALEAPLRPQAASMWKRRGIPYRYRAALAIEAQARKLRVPHGFLGEAAPDADIPPFLREG